MSAAEWTDVYDIYHWRTLWSGSWTHNHWIPFRLSNDWAIRPWIQFALRFDFVQSLQFHRLFSVRFHFGYCLRQFPHLFLLRFCRGNHMSVAEWTDVCGIYHWRTLWRSYRKLDQVGLEPTTTEFHSDSLTNWTIRPWVQFAIEANFVQSLQFHHFSVSDFNLAIAFVSHHVYLNWNFVEVIPCVAEYTDIYSIHHWKTL